MLICYVDESGDEQALRSSTDPPVLVIAGLVVGVEQSKSLIMDFLQLKTRFVDRALGPEAKLSDVIRHEIKGSDLRTSLRADSRRRRRRAIGLLDNVMTLLEVRSVRLISEVLIKADGRDLGRWIYADSVARLAERFEAQLDAVGTSGLMILDARTKYKNVPSVHGITTRKFKKGGDGLSHLVESPVFGHRDAHMVIQVADIVASALLFPMACAAYCDDLAGNVHVSSGYETLRNRYGARLRRIEHRYVDPDGRKRGGVRVIDTRNRRPSLDLFRSPTTAIRQSRAPALVGAQHADVD